MNTHKEHQHETQLPLSEQLRSLHPHLIDFATITPADKQRVGNKGYNLAIMSQHGIPVPPGVCLTTDAFDEFQHAQQINESLLNEIDRIRQVLGGSIAVRSSATCEDGNAISFAGVFETIYLRSDENKLLQSRQEIAQALQRIYQQATSPEVRRILAIHHIPEESCKVSVTVQQLVPAEKSGVLYTNVNNGRSLVQYVDGFGHRLVDGEDEGHSALIDESGRVVDSKHFFANPLSAENISQLILHTTTAQNIFLQPRLDVEFATTDGKVHILQARPLTTAIDAVDFHELPSETLHHVKAQLTKEIAAEKASLRSEHVIFSDSNFSELLPHPKEMDVGIFAYIFTGSDGVPGAIQLGRQAMGYPLKNESVGYMKYLGGRPYFSLAGDAHTFYAGFPPSIEEYNTSLVAEYLQSVQQFPDRGVYPEMGLYLQDPTLKDLHQRYGDQAETYFATYQHFKEHMAKYADQFIDDFYHDHLPEMTQSIELMTAFDAANANTEQILHHIHLILEHLRTQSCVHFVKAARLGFYYAQRLQSFLRHHTELKEADIEVAFAALSQGLEGSAITEANLAIAHAATFAEALRIGKEKVGHYSTGEMLEIRHPRLGDSPERLEHYVRGIFDQRLEYLQQVDKQRAERLKTFDQLLSQLGGQHRDEFQQIVHAAQTYMALRETVKYHFTMEYAHVRNGLEQLGQRLHFNDGDIYSTFPHELTELVQSPTLSLHMIRERQQAFANYAQLDLPPVIREEDVSKLSLKHQESALALEMTGKLLANGPTIDDGVIINIEEHPDIEAVSTMIRDYKVLAVPIILVASQMNLHHDPLIMESAGLIIENAGFVSHGAQRARELGRGALGSISTHQLKTGERVVFDPQQRKVTRKTVL